MRVKSPSMVESASSVNSCADSLINSELVGIPNVNDALPLTACSKVIVAVFTVSAVIVAGIITWSFSS